VYFPVFLNLLDQGIDSVNLQSISSVNDNRLELAEKEGNVEATEYLNCQKGADQKRYSDVNDVNDFSDKVLLVCQVANRSNLMKGYMSSSRKKAIMSYNSKTMPWY
jgi:hypothetical protein